MKANGAQVVTAHGIPQRATRKVAKGRDLASGAKTIVAANIMCEIIHAICRSGRTKANFLRNRTTPGGGRGANDAFLFSGDRIPNGRTTELTNVIRENITRERLPMRPTSPRVSVDFAPP